MSAFQRSLLELAMESQLKEADLGPFETEYRFHATREWRFDFAWPELKVALECDGGTYTGGRHTRGAGFAEDCVKLNEAALDGWMVIRVVTKQIDSRAALAWIQRALEG